MQVNKQPEGLNMYDAYKKVMDFIVKIFTAIVYLAFIFIPISLFVGTVARYILKHPLVGIDELAVLALVAMTLCGSAVVYYQKKYIIIDVFVKRLKGKTKVVVDILANLLNIFVMGLLLYCFYIAIPVQYMFRTGIFNIPKSVYGIGLIITFTFMLICCIETIISDLKGKVKDSGETGEIN